MPNTLCHIGIQAPLSRLLDKEANLLLIVIACIIPDIPWILQRVLLILDLFNPYDLRLFCIGQASLLFCLVLAATLSLLTIQPIKVFALLATNCLFHLLLDATQVKWANGVHLLAPLGQARQYFGITWPEHPIWQAVTVFGFCYLLRHWAKTVRPSKKIFTGTHRQLFPALALFLIYLFGPLLFIPHIEQANNGYIQTLRETTTRSGKLIELDRVPYSHERQTLTTFTGEQITLTGKTPEQSGLISVKGRFLSTGIIKAETVHSHSRFRDYASYFGLFMACALIVHSVILSRKNNQYPPINGPFTQGPHI